MRILRLGSAPTILTVKHRLYSLLQLVVRKSSEGNYVVLVGTSEALQNLHRTEDLVAGTCAGAHLFDKSCNTAATVSFRATMGRDVQNSLPPCDGESARVRELEKQVARLQKENQQLRARQTATPFFPSPSPPLQPVAELSKEQIERYSRQLLLNEGFGVEGQCKLLSSSVLVVGAGGIGSTVLLYLAASGVGKISIVDFDAVEVSNLHRQVIHNSHNVGVNKAASACRAVLDLNPSIQCDALSFALTHDNALELVQNYDCIVDASDNPRTRYLINDACVLANKPLVSGSAVGLEGQLTVYNWKGGPCYRCLYPKADVSAGCLACSDAGVLGPVPGCIGVLQSVEAMKILTGVGSTMHDRLLMYDALRCSFFTVKKPEKAVGCPVCGPQATILSMQDSRGDLTGARGLTGFGGIPMPHAQEMSLPENAYVSCEDYRKVREQDLDHVLLDVRGTRQFEMCALDGAVNIPLARIPDELDRLEELSNGSKPVYCVCRRGVASMDAARILYEAKNEGRRIHSVRHIEGGLTAWHTDVDSTFPKY